MARPFRRRLPFVLLPLFALACLLFPGAGAAGQGTINCSIQEGPCTRSAGNATVTLDILPKPVEAMRELTFRVRVAGSPPPKPPVIDLDMPAMEMGPNQVQTERVNATLFRGTGVIVRCPSGNRVWRARVILPGRGQADFVFRVRY
jgi:hypothetical protein